jgi:(E)-2-((N-methylformamido)methylene)succinate hydrolase
MALKEANGFIHAVSQGRGEPVILLHGIAASLYDWNRMIPDLAGYGYRALAADLPGHGESFKPADPEAYRVEMLYEHMERWIGEETHGEPVFLVGHSMGGYLSLLYALHHANQVRGLVLINQLYSPQQLTPLLQAVSRRPHVGEKALRLTPEWMMNLIMGWDPGKPAYFPAEARRQIANDYKRASPHIVYITRSIPDLIPSLSQVSTPSLLIWGEKDQTLQPDSFPRLAELIPGAVSSAIPGCGHQPHIGQPTLVNHLTLDFLNSLG